mgnify:CR=1 FL=1
MPKNNIINLFEEILDSSSILSGDELKSRFYHIWKTDISLESLCLLLPKSSKEISSIVKICNDNNQEIIFYKMLGPDLYLVNTSNLIIRNKNKIFINDTFEINNDYNGATERHAYRRMYDERIDLTFYVDGRNYLPIKFFELWMDYIDGSIDPNNLPATGDDLTQEAITESNPKLQPDYTYRVRYPRDYQSDTIQILKFEKNYNKIINEFNYIIKNICISTMYILISFNK